MNKIMLALLLYFVGLVVISLILITIGYRGPKTTERTPQGNYTPLSVDVSPKPVVPRVPHIVEKTQEEFDRERKVDEILKLLDEMNKGNHKP